VKPVRLAIVGATGLVGRTTLDVLAEWQIPLRALRLFASDESAGRMMTWNGRSYALEPLASVPLDVDAAILATSRKISQQWAPRFREAGVIVIDHSSAFRMDTDVPLIIPEVNGRALNGHTNLIANPNCSASVVVLPLAALNREFQLRAIVVDTYQSVSGSGQDAVAELDAQLADSQSPAKIYPRPIAHNVFPQVGPFDVRGLCDEEQKVVDELRKILECPQLSIFTTTVRVPVRVGHSAAVTVECMKAVSRADVETAFRNMPGMIYEADTYKTPREIAGKQEVFVSRLRVNESDPRWLQFWAVGDNLRKGAASNAVQILMELFRD